MHLNVCQEIAFSTRWQLMDSEYQLPLFSLPVETEQQGTLSVAEKAGDYQFSPTRYDELMEDYAATGLSLQNHPIGLLRQSGKLGRCLTAKELIEVRHKSVVTVAGVVTGRQSPGTASGVTFMTLEDETGNINVVVWMATARAQKQRFLSARLLKVKGIVEREQEVIHVIAGRLIDLTEYFDELATHSRDFH